MIVEVSCPKWTMDSDGAWISLKVSSPQEARKICDAMQQGERYTADIKKLRKKRSRNANDYLWVLCTEISEVLSTDKLYVSKEQIYRKHIKESGACDYLAVPEKAVESLVTAWGQKGIGWFAEVVDFIPGKEIDKCKKVCVYYGSSTYDVKEMSRLLGSVIQEANDLGIETITERERSLLIEDWRVRYEANAMSENC